jgi:hypothetical protein
MKGININNLKDRNFILDITHNKAEALEFLESHGQGVMGSFSYYVIKEGKIVDRHFRLLDCPSGLPIYTIDNIKSLAGISEGKIIGYKCPRDLFGGDVKAGTLYVKVCDASHNYKPTCTRSTFWMPKEIVEEWEKVYEEEKVMEYHFSNLGTPTRRITVNSKGQIKVVGTEYMFTRKHVEELHNTLEVRSLFAPDLGGLHATITIRVGCDREGSYFDTKELKQILDKYDELNPKS